MQNEILINASRGETRVAILERGTLAELLVERRGEHSMVGSVVKGRVTRVLPGMQASFVDIGLEKAAFLYAGDYYDYNDVDLGDDDAESRPRPQRRGGRRNGSRIVPKIDTILSEGQEIVVQVAKEPIGTKGARITSHVAIAGRHLVLTPSGSRVGVSRRIESDRERRRLREIVERLRPRDVGFIIRTAGDGAREADLEADVKYLASAWADIKNRRDARAPAVLYAEPSLPLRVVRDVANPETKRIVVDSRQVYDEMMSFVSRFVADPKPKVELYHGALPIFDQFGIEAEIDANLGRKVWLKSGGYLIVDQSEALTAIDVNTGRYVGKRDLEETVLKTNLEAVKEVVHQLRFRNIGGLIIIDLIDMETAENREKVYRALQEALRQDKAKTNILKISELGLVEMTRKRTRENLVQQLCEPCAYCEGRGYVLSRESVSQKVLREIRKDLPRFCGRRIAIAVGPRVAELLLGHEKEALAELEAELGREIEVRGVPGMHQEHFEVIALEDGPPVDIPLAWLGTGAPAIDPATVTSAPDVTVDSLAAAAVEDSEDDAEPVAETTVPSFLSASLEDFSPLDLGEGESEPERDARSPFDVLEREAAFRVLEGAESNSETVDAESNFPILPRPEQGEES
jgi:ribonuclease G